MTTQGFLSKCLLPSLFQRPWQHLCLGTALSFPVEDTTLTFEFGGTCHSPTPDKIVQRTLLHLKNNEDETFISINCLKYVTIIINYCASLTAFLESKITDDPHPVVLCFTDNISAKNKKLMITFRIQKNQQNGRSITFVPDVKHPHICPVRSA